MPATIGSFEKPPPMLNARHECPGGAPDTMSAMEPATGERVDYDEFGLFQENAAEYKLPFQQPPIVRRVSVEVAAGRDVSGLIWGDSSLAPEIVFLHGGSQNAHTWDTVAMALGRPALAIDLPGHGHSDWRSDGGYTPMSMADDVAVVIGAHAPDARVVVGMSMGGLTAMVLAARHPTLVRRLVMVDITPGVDRAKTKAITDFVNGPQSFDSFRSLLDRTIQHNPTRSLSSLRRGILHNARQLDDGSWQWRYDRTSHSNPTPVEMPVDALAEAESAQPATDARDAMAEILSPLWIDFASIQVPMMLVCGSLSPVVDDADVAEALRLQPSLTVEVVDGAGHSVQGDRPVELAVLISDCIGRTHGATSG